ncbi:MULTISPECIES: PQQ-binding-like beta-propeller repeat protein [unclassified Streptomyces]|uniref:outer membrane protein assembly factor BamB family protein n=1 Tax=unclassified Streptomyces TaxID=2593676 RepID=UPI000DB9ABC0|nr:MULTISPECIES: PQQ-binding-like beta-propeller repeat protein [unclassified Streptomyces]MYT75368.1 PQQ-binding-like beta-propeller repeat protein [Streptomyces sp. SID8367]RAJ86770.1 putative pyrroloquinoline-quinone binding quinoprotein [Streptomyces sp. PsTaAH-137]
MSADQLDRAIRDVLHGLTPDNPAAPAGIADRIVRRRQRRNITRAAGAALAIAAVTVSAVLVTGGDTHRGTQPPASGTSTTSKLLWRTTLPGGTDWRACTTGPATVYCQGARYDALAVDARTGKITWKTRAASNDGSSAMDLPGVRDGIFYGYADHAPGTSAPGTDVVARDVTSHHVLWRHKVADDSRDRFSAVLFDGGVLANTPTFKKAAALDDKTGRTLWTYAWKQADCDQIAVAGVPYLTCSPDSEKAPQHSTVVRLDPVTGEARTVATVKGPTMYVGTDGRTVLLAGKPGGGGSGPVTVTRVDTRSGVVTRHKAARYPGSVIADGITLGSRYGEGVASTAADGRNLWTRDLGLTLRKDPRLFDQREAPSDPAVDLKARVAYYLDPSGNLVGLDLDSGSVRWRGRVQLPETEVSSGVAPELILYGHSLVGQIGDHLFRIEPRPGS